MLLKLAVVCFFVAHCYGGKIIRGRDVVSTLSVTNGAEWGTWRKDEMCADGTFATAFKINVSFFMKPHNFRETC